MIGLKVTPQLNWHLSEILDVTDTGRASVSL
jgi:hypothetical protein